MDNVKDWFNCSDCGFANGAQYKVAAEQLFLIYNYFMGEISDDLFFQVPEGCCGWEKVDGTWQATNTTSLEVRSEKFAK